MVRFCHENKLNGHNQEWSIYFVECVERKAATATQNMMHLCLCLSEISFMHVSMYLLYVQLFLGFRTTKGSRLLGSRFEEQRLTLRIHRGRSVQNHHGHVQNNTPKPISPNGRLHHHSSSSRIPRSRSLERIKVHLTPPPQRGKQKSFKTFLRMYICMYVGCERNIF